jgi:cystathionine beta-lyase
MTNDFTTVHDRSGTHSLKWDHVQGDRQTAPIPLWVADMDFAAPPAALEALQARIAHPIFGYTDLPAGYRQTLSNWNNERYGRDWAPSAFLAAPSVLHALSMAVRAFTQPGDRILNLTPVYQHFYELGPFNGRENFDVPLVRRGRWEIDYAALDQALTAARAEGKPVKALAFSAPQNPTGRVWTRPELTALGELARRHDFLIFSDEIHSDLVAPGHQHLGPLDLPELADRTLVFAGPNKTFNLAGLPLSHVVALDPKLRQTMHQAIETDFFAQPNVLSLAAAWACYEKAGGWLDELRQVIADNKAVLDRWIADLNRGWHLSPAVESAPLEATYLAWVDARALVQRGRFADDKALASYVEKTTRVKFTPGSNFGVGGENHLRVNLATPRALLEEGLARVRAALETVSTAG